MRLARVIKTCNDELHSCLGKGILGNKRTRFNIIEELCNNGRLSNWASLEKNARNSPKRIDIGVPFGFSLTKINVDILPFLFNPQFQCRENARWANGQMRLPK